MDERIWTIAEILDQSGPMTADELAAQLKLSGKTVRSLIKTYAKEMQENGFCITAKPGRGFGIEITDAQTYVSGSKPQQGEQTGIPQDAQERIQRLRQYLLEKDGYSKLDDLSEQFFVSRRSISNDLREVERQLAEYGLSIRRKPGYGICVVGRETNRRICIAAQRDESRPVGQQIQELVSRVLEKEKFLNCSNSRIYNFNFSTFAERRGFEPRIPFWGIHAFQACLFNHSSTSPFRGAKVKEVFETTKYLV